MSSRLLLSLLRSAGVGFVCLVAALLSTLHVARATGDAKATPIRPFALTLLDEVGNLRYTAPDSEYQSWKRELATSGHLSRERQALLHIRVGEYELAANQQPQLAGWHFRIARADAPRTSPLYGWAAYDESIALFDVGAYEASYANFSSLLLARKPALTGFPRRNAALWLGHARACVAQHSALRALGVPVPRALDPLCGVAGLYISARSLGLPVTREQTITATHITGRGTSAQDLVDAADSGKLGSLVGRTITADEAGFQALPKPLIAWVSRDHFVTVTGTDRSGVHFSCTDCGPVWPGGDRSLTWKQWRAMQPGVYVSIVKKDSAQDRALASVLSGKRRSSGVSVAMAGKGGFGDLLQVTALERRLTSHIATLVLANTVICGNTPSATQCNPIINCPKAGGGGGCDGTNDPVNLANSQEEYSAGDLVVWNPHGPSVTWGHALRACAATIWRPPIATSGLDGRIPTPSPSSIPLPITIRL